ncbi:MAG TPA: porin family protein [Pseudomonadales bacterium]|nr:porin family protein [Pseudomonadales bacterium]
MKSVFLGFLGGALLLSAGSAFAEGSYVGANYLASKVEFDSDSFDSSQLFVRFGADLTENFGAEIRAGFGLSSDSVSYGTSDADAKLELKVDRFVGFYGTVSAPVTPNFKPYLILGYTDVKLSADISFNNVPGYGTGSVSESDSDSGLSYGVGTDIKLSDKVSLNGEYMQYYDEDDVKLSGIAIGAKMAF